METISYAGSMEAIAFGGFAGSSQLTLSGSLLIRKQGLEELNYVGKELPFQGKLYVDTPSIFG